MRPASRRISAKTFLIGAALVSSTARYSASASAGASCSKASGSAPVDFVGENENRIAGLTQTANYRTTDAARSPVHNRNFCRHIFSGGSYSDSAWLGTTPSLRD